MSLHVVWHKRDLRWQDHLPLAEAARCGPVMPVYLHEPLVLNAPDCSAQHQAFVEECLAELARDYAALGGRLLQLAGNAVDAFEALWQATRFTDLWAYQESGTRRTFERDLAVLAWARQRGVRVHELEQNGVKRGSAYRRDGFDFQGFFERTLTSECETLTDAARFADPVLADSPASARARAAGVDKPLRLRGGRSHAQALLDAFFVPERLLAYPGSISSPLSAEGGCSRLSPYLEHGIVSVREVAHRLRDAAWAVHEAGPPELAARMDDALRFFAERMYWRSAYMQAFETDCDIETVPQHLLMKTARQDEFNEAWFEAWKAGRTGIPMIDAAMRMLHEHGWINMRSRGMLISFAVNELWLHWREPGLFLAREFLDYCPAIHWCQMQIHGGTAARSEPLTYNPIKQAQDHDPKGVFVRRWVPELGAVPLELLFEPWKAPRALASHGVTLGLDYPAPIVPQAAANDAARQTISAMRAGEPVPQLAYTRQRLAALAQQRQAGLF